MILIGPHHPLDRSILVRRGTDMLQVSSIGLDGYLKPWKALCCLHLLDLSGFSEIQRPGDTQKVLVELYI